MYKVTLFVKGTETQHFSCDSIGTSANRQAYLHFPKDADIMPLLNAAISYGYEYGKDENDNHIILTVDANDIMKIEH